MEIVRVLILVDEHILELAFPEVAHIVEFCQELDGVEDDVVKVHRARGKQAAPVFGVDLADLHAADIAHGFGGLRILLGRDLGVLRGADLREHGAVGIRLLVEIHVLEDVLHDGLAVGGIIDREARGIAQPLAVPAQDAHARGVERRRPDIVRRGTEHVFQTVLQLARRLVRKRNGDDAPRIDAPIGGLLAGERIVRVIGVPRAALKERDLALVGVRHDLVGVRRAPEPQQICDSVDEHGRLAASGAGEQQQRSLSGEHRLALHGVEAHEFRLDEASARFDITFFIHLFHNN